MTPLFLLLCNHRQHRPKGNDLGNANPPSNVTSVSTCQIDQSFKYPQRQQPELAGEWEAAGPALLGPEAEAV